MKIGILGGTFDPIHTGHLALAHAAQNQFLLDRVLFVPAFIPPHKAARRDITPAPYRFRMVELALRDEPSFEVSDIELNRPSISYTVDTLRELKKRHPEDEFFLILGEDAFQDFSTWRDPAAIRDLARFLIAPRGAGRDTLPDPEAQWIEMEECPISSSGIREKIRQHTPVSALVPAAAEAYIRRMKLYTKEAPCT
jgi:nicotinate-nucleotide adenylyltransferase